MLLFQFVQKEKENSDFFLWKIYPRAAFENIGKFEVNGKKGYDVDSIAGHQWMKDYASFAGWTSDELKIHLVNNWLKIAKQFEAFEKTNTAPNTDRQKLAVFLALTYINQDRTGVDAEFLQAIALKESKIAIGRKSEKFAAPFQMAPSAVAGVVQSNKAANKRLEKLGFEPIEMEWNSGWDAKAMKFNGNNLVEKKGGGGWKAGEAWNELPDNMALSVIYASMRIVLCYPKEEEKSKNERKATAANYNWGPNRKSYADSLVDQHYKWLKEGMHQE